MTDSIYDLSFTSNTGEEVPLEQFRGQPMLIVNTASKCGLTPQYRGLQEIYSELGPEGLVVIGFPCDQFANQEPGDDDQIKEFCEINYGVSFPLSTKIDVNGSKTHPVFSFLKDRTDGLLGSAIKWNFTKFLVWPDGTTVKRYGPQTSPDEVRGDAEEMLNGSS
ncbi:MAG: glutathione peroxidase [Candidatus Nanopelagicales bacterium]